VRLRRRLVSIACALCVSAFVVGPMAHAWAAPRRGADTPERREAAADFKRGKQLYAAADYAGALAAFQSGFDRYPLRGFLVNIGQCQRRLGHLREAAAAYQQFLDGTDIASALRTEVEEALAEVKTAQREVGEVDPSDATPKPAEVTPSIDPAQNTTHDPTPPGALLSSDASVKKSPAERKKTKPWVWALVGVGAVVVVAGVTVGVIFGTRSSGPSGGSLGLIDGRSH